MFSTVTHIANKVFSVACINSALKKKKKKKGGFQASFAKKKREVLTVFRFSKK